jgi:hypothetical protein
MEFAQPPDVFRLTVIDVVKDRIMRATDLAGLASEFTLANQFSSGCSTPGFV